jgi:hypothetical protein
MLLNHLFNGRIELRTFFTACPKNPNLHPSPLNRACLAIARGHLSMFDAPYATKKIKMPEETALLLNIASP